MATRSGSECGERCRTEGEWSTRGVPYRSIPRREPRRMRGRRPRSRRNPMAENDLSPDALLRTARDVLQQEARAIAGLAEQLGAPFLAAAEMLRTCRGMVVVAGMGKAGLVGAKLSATLSSTGTRSYFLHPAEAAHGDLGRLDEQDVVLALSFSGTTDEVLRLIE